MEENEILGYDDAVEGEEDILGAVRSAIRRRGGRVLPRPALPAAPTKPAKLRSYLGFGSTSWGATDSADKTLTVEPQEAFRGERLVIDVTATGTPAGLTVVRRIDVGSLPQSPSTEAAAPAAMFAKDAVGSALDLQVARAGVKFSVTLGQTAAPGGTVTVTAAVGCYGEWVR